MSILIGLQHYYRRRLVWKYAERWGNRENAEAVTVTSVSVTRTREVTRLVIP